jgi:hypothetical protein
MPGGGRGYGGSSVWAAGGGGGYSAVSKVWCPTDVLFK